ncbi:MAG TPA: hypothetical protein VIW46_02970 [Acidimicrobiia bacterium]
MPTVKQLTPGSIEPPAADVRPLGEAILIPIEHEAAAIASNLRFVEHLAAVSGGVLQPLVIVTSTSQRDVDAGRDRVDRCRIARRRDSARVG